MTDSSTDAPNKTKDNTRGLILLLLLLPVMCGVIVLASQIAAKTRATGIEGTIEPIETADYSSWDRTVFAPISADIITQVVLEIAATNGDTSFLETATQAAIATHNQQTVIAQTPTATSTPNPSNTPLPTNTNTPMSPSPTEAPTLTDKPTSTEKPISTDDAEKN
ncbi:MAG: hypothetical protein Q9P44_09325 [Anaerolineae bacterium]|nr:hypothetical protein [Anaerolineae bacterium]